ncbi:hypothetical protein F53441_5915 [Fusarium austroafricanum]|uniref:Zn(2)-C6 fungal-type domain-containing protein n=1 Tax=Fusarium austroafricanum TaxID=2364996 RepID=A0A8H4P055_9HYPO|nr:hypothetical protein F53441_5915 [Fusarium austroafricanum]
MPKQPSKVERTRTFTGCRTCRSRHAKCDEAQPECGTCKRLGLACGGYGARLFWIKDDTVKPELQQSHRGTEYRYPLFSERERKLMSDELKGSLGRRTVLALLADIDSACEKTDVGNDALLKGPFGVFQSIEDPLPSVSDTITCSPDTNTDSTSMSMYPENDFIEEIQRSDWPEDELDIFTASLDPNFNINPEDTGLPDQLHVPDQTMANFFVDDPMGAEGLALFSPGFISQVIGHDNSADVEENLDPELQPAMNEVVPYPRNIQSQTGLPEEAEPLLRHYRQHIAGQRSSMKAKRKSPWEIIFLPCALETFAELSLWGEASHTRTSLFYTLLAHSALQLHMSRAPNSFSTDWKEIGLRNHDRAQNHLRQALQHEMFGPKQASYKELLMAILAMAMTSMHKGALSFRLFLLDAERLIRLRGLANRNPFKTRLLHHMYTHLRVIAESISLRNEPLLASTSEIQDISQGRTFRITEEGLNIGLDPAQEKNDDLGYNDIHLEVQGRWTQTLYPVIYGIPESLMTLLSQTVSLSNEKNRLESVARCNPSISEALAKHTKTLENRIWAWPTTLDPAEPVKMPTGTDQDLLTHPQVRSMTLAIHQALVIYFYRRVYDMNAMILQDLVQKTLDYLEPCLSELIDDQDFATSLAWPAFVAACEAVAPDLQERALTCLGVTDDKGVYFTPKPAKVVVPLIWDKRKQSGDWTMSWQSLVLDSMA